MKFCIRRNIRMTIFFYTAEFPYGEIFLRLNFLPRNFFTAKFPYGKISLSRNFFMAKFPSAVVAITVEVARQGGEQATLRPCKDKTQMEAQCVMNNSSWMTNQNSWSAKVLENLYLNAFKAVLFSFFFPVLLYLFI